MRWKIEQYVFCDKQQSLKKVEEKQQLEPMAVELLSYLCQHPDQVISRDQLIEHVWLGRVVSDNAVNRVVTKLRKAFNDDPKKPLFIATLPKKGYKFIAAVEPYEPVHVEAVLPKIPDEVVSKIKKPAWTGMQYKVLFFTSIFVVLFLSFLSSNWLSKDVKEYPQNTLVQVGALTRDAGRESLPRVSPDQKYLAYAERKNQKMHLWVKSLDDQRRVEINHGNTPDTWVGPASWNVDGTKIAYLVTTSNSCEYFVRDADGLNLGKPRLIHQCPSGSYGKIEFLHSDTRFVYTAAPHRDAPYELFELDIRSGEKRKLPQPDLVLGGNSQFDVHPTENKILISSPDKQQWEGFYSLDLDNDHLELLFKQDAFICCGIWDHSGTRVVLMGEYPAFELVSYDLSGEDPQIIYSGIHQLRPPNRHSNGLDYLFVSGHVNQNIHYLKPTGNESAVLINASVDDRLAVSSNTAAQVAYVSLSSGNEEIWLSDHQGKEKRKLTRFNDSRHYFDLQWFPDELRLVGLTINEIHLINAKTGTYEKLDLPQNEYRALSVKDRSTIAFSLKVEGQWRLHFYYIERGKLEIQDEQWQFARFSVDPQDNLWVDNNNQVYSGSEKSRLQLPKTFDRRALLQGKTFSLQKLGNKLVWQQFDGGAYQLFEQVGEQPAKLLLATDSRHFDLSAKGILYHKVESANADIYTTLAN